MSHYSQHSWITFIKITANVQQQINSTRGKERKQQQFKQIPEYDNHTIYDMNPIRMVSSSVQSFSTTLAPQRCCIVCNDYKTAVVRGAHSNDKIIIYKIH